MMKTKKLLMLSVIVAILFTLANLAMGWTATDPGYDLEYARSDRGVLPEFVTGNTPQSVDGYMVFKQNYDEDGFKLNGETDPVLFTFYLDDLDPMDSEQILKVWLAYHEGDGKTYVYRWESEGIEVYNFMVKGGENFLVYSYDGSFTWDGHLISPRVGIEDQNIADISHIDIVFKPISEETEPSETETEPSETQTETTGPEDETVTETSASQTETTGPADETVTETSQTESLTDESIPLASTTPAGTTIADEEIPQTGESGNGLIIGLILLGLASSLTYVMHRSQKQKNK